MCTYMQVLAYNYTLSEGEDIMYECQEARAMLLHTQLGHRATVEQGMNEGRKECDDYLPSHHSGKQNNELGIILRDRRLGRGQK